MRKKNNGITLIALVITIIILLILAGISIAMLTGENGILTKAWQAKDSYQKEAAREKVQIAVLNYQVNEENTTLYDELRKIEGITLIEPDNEREGPPYRVIVDGYEFIVGEDLKISGGEKVEIKRAPEIKEVKYETEGTEAPLEVMITAVTKDEEGIKQIKVSYIKREGETVKYEDIAIENEGNVMGKEVKITVQIPANGEYVIQVIGKNGTITKKEIIIDNLVKDTILATITTGTVNEDHVGLTITGTTTEFPIKEMELYIDGKKIENVTYTTDEEMNKVASYTINNMEFYKEYACYVKVINAKGKEGISETKRPRNTTIIKTQTDLKNLATQVNNGNTFSQHKALQIVENIDLQNNPWVPIGNNQHKFSGVLNGNGHTISNLYINNGALEYQGLFGCTSYATICNLTINSGSINAKNNCGAIVGYFENGKIENCINNIGVTGSNNIGGIIGWDNNVAGIENCINTGNIRGNTSVGGVTGKHQANGTVKKCGNIGTITGNQQIGGIVGTSMDSSIESTYNKGIISVSVNQGGGIVGYCTETGILYSYNTANVTGSYMVGGIAGMAFKSETGKKLAFCYNKGAIKGTGSGSAGFTNIGGIVGVAKHKIIVEFCYNMGTIQITSNGGHAGGIAGILISNDADNPNSYYASKVQYCYNSATVSANGKYVGGIVGHVDNYCSVKNCNVSSDLIVRGNGKTATANRGQQEDYIGKIVGNLGIVSSDYLGNNTNSITVSVYYVVNGHSSGSSSYWSNSNVNQPKLIWE